MTLPFVTMDMSKFKDGRVNFRNPGMQGLIMIRILLFFRVGDWVHVTYAQAERGSTTFIDIAFIKCLKNFGSPWEKVSEEYMRTAKVMISLRFRAGWSKPSPSAYRIICSCRIYWCKVHALRGYAGWTGSFLLASALKGACIFRRHGASLQC